MIGRIDLVSFISPVCRIAAMLAAVNGVIGSSQALTISSTFDTGADGWIAAGNGAGGVGFDPAIGNPGGALSITDVDNAYAYFRAPAKFVNAAAYGETLSYDLRVTADGDHSISTAVQAVLEGNGMTLIMGLNLPTGSFANYEFDLTETAGWRLHGDRNTVYNPAEPAPTQAQFQAVLSGLTGMFLSADHTNGTTSTGTTEVAILDNVALTVPEPSALTIAGFLALALMRRRLPAGQW